MNSNTAQEIDIDYTFGRPLSTYIGSIDSQARLLILRGRVRDGEFWDDGRFSSWAILNGTIRAE